MALNLDCTSEVDTMRHFYIGQGSWADTSLYTIWKKMPAYMSKVGLSEDQENTNRFFQYMRAEPTLFIKGFHGIVNSKFYGEDLRLFSYKDHDRLSASAVVNLVTGRPVTEHQAFEMLIVNDEYGQTLADKIIPILFAETMADATNYANKIAETMTVATVATVATVVTATTAEEPCPVDMDLVEFRAKQLAIRMTEL